MEGRGTPFHAHMMPMRGRQIYMQDYQHRETMKKSFYGSKILTRRAFRLERSVLELWEQLITLNSKTT